MQGVNLCSEITQAPAISAGVMGNMADFPLTVNIGTKIHHCISIKYPNFSIGTFRDYARLHASFL
jgi:hypothetical protein